MIDSVELVSYRGGLESFEFSAILQNTKKWRFEICFVDDPALVQVLSQEAERGKIGQLLIKDVLDLITCVFKLSVLLKVLAHI